MNRFSIDPSKTSFNFEALANLRGEVKEKRIIFTLSGIRCLPSGQHEITFTTKAGIQAIAIVEGALGQRRIDIQKWIHLTLPSLGVEAPIPRWVQTSWDRGKITICGLEFPLPRFLPINEKDPTKTGRLFVTGASHTITGVLLNVKSAESFNTQFFDVNGSQLDGHPNALHLGLRFFPAHSLERTPVSVLEARRGALVLTPRKLDNIWEVIGDCLTYRLPVDCRTPTNMTLQRYWPALGSVFLLGLGFGLWNWAQSDDKWALNRENLDLAYNALSLFIPMGLGASLASGFVYDEVASCYT